MHFCSRSYHLVINCKTCCHVTTTVAEIFFVVSYINNIDFVCFTTGFNWRETGGNGEGVSSPQT